MEPNKRLVIRPDDEPSTAQRGTKLYTHGDSRQHLSFCGAIFPLRWTEGAAAVCDDTLLIILNLTEDSTQAKITRIRVQYVVSRLCGKGQNGGPDERVS